MLDGAEPYMKDTTSWQTEQREMLTMRRRELLDGIQNRIRAGRGGPGHEIRDALEQTDADTQGDLAMALLQSQSATLARVDQALMRLDAGTYGMCSACSKEIASARLRALPFAVRCQACESDREREQGPRERARQSRGLSLFPDPSGP
jgi:DnaK suppressor protein